MTDPIRIKNPSNVAFGSNLLYVYSYAASSQPDRYQREEWDVELILTRKAPVITPGWWRDRHYMYAVRKVIGKPLEYRSLDPSAAFLDTAWHPLSEIEDMYLAEWRPVKFPDYPADA